ncbi:MAG: META domain-containing protein [Bacteroidetes bacterium]|nr:META domain-containing protein [Bacteroidota bacterium]
MLTEFQDFTKDFLVQKGANLDLSHKGQYGAKMGCNRMFMKADFKADGTVVFSQIGSTMMFCEDAMKLEDAFGKALPVMTRYKIDGHFLTLTSKDGSTMKFVAADWD